MEGETNGQLGASLPQRAPNASAEKNRRCNVHRRHDRNGDRLRVDYLHHFYSAQIRRRLEDLFQNPHPVFPQNFFDLIVAETTLNQSAGEIARVRMVP